MKQIFTLLILITVQHLSAQVKLSKLTENKHFNWNTDSSSQELTIYYLPRSKAERHIDSLSQRVLHHLHQARSFANVQFYDSRIHLFIVESRQQMKLLLGHETNGSAFYKANIVTGIFSENTNSIYSNHEFFHVIAMNLWGKPNIWINEGLAVYSDDNWHGYDLYQLTAHLVEQNRIISLSKLLKDFKGTDTMIAYPLIGSFVKYLDETYGRDVVIKIWKSKSKNLKIFTGKSVDELETEWLSHVGTIQHHKLHY